MTPRASFVIPAYNAQKYLATTIKSCLDQSIKQIEVVVVNDGSTDGTGELIEWFISKDDRVVMVSPPANVGRSEARNLGNWAAKSPYIFVLDADDTASKNRVKDTLAAFVLKKADVVYGPFWVMDEMGNDLQRAPAGNFVADLAKRRKQNYICHSTMAYKKHVAEKIPYLSGEYASLGIDDWRFQWDCYKAGFKFAITKAPLSHYRLTADGISNTRDNEAVIRVKDQYLATV
jgi:glycosyltransferase involved in cell wall biosynthesis